MMQIDHIVCPEHIEDKLESVHNVTYREARQALLNKPRIRFAEKGILREKMSTLTLGEQWVAGIWQYSLCTNPPRRQLSSLAQGI